MTKERLVLFDGNAIIHRAYWAFPLSLTTKKGEIVNAVYGFSRMLLKALEDLKPKFVICAFDLPGPNFRHQAFIGYQAHRPEMEADLASQIDKVHQVVEALGIPIFTQPGFEADDVLGTLSKLAKRRRKNLEVIIVTGDKDILQLVEKRIKVLIPNKGFAAPTLFGPKKVKEALGVTPDQIIDYKALMGDSSDNYPGVSGIGPKTACQLLDRFSTLDQIYKNLDKIESESIRKKLEEGRESAFLSQKLAKIVIDLKLKLKFKQARFSYQKATGAVELFEELGFKSLIKRLPGSSVREEREKQMSLI